MNKQSLSWFILQSVSGGVTLSIIPYFTDENLAKVHQTPLVSCGPTLRGVSRPLWREPLVSPLVWITERDDTYILLKVLFIHNNLSITCLLIYHGSVIYSISGKMSE